MRLRSILVTASLLASAGCSHEPAGSEPRTPDSPRTVASCLPPGLESARPADRFDLPSGCSFTLAGSPNAPHAITDAAGLTAAVSCTEGGSVPSFDLAAKDLYVVRYSMSPASRGLAPYDDGTTVTLVTRFRQPCEGDPLPMPMNATIAFALPKGATRIFREANCNLPLDCR